MGGGHPLWATEEGPYFLSRVNWENGTDPGMGVKLCFVVKRDGDFTRQTQGLTPETPPQCLAAWGTTVPKEGHGVGVGVLVLKENCVQLSGLPMLLSRKPVICGLSRGLLGLLEPLLPLRKRMRSCFTCMGISNVNSLYIPSRACTTHGHSKKGSLRA